MKHLIFIACLIFSLSSFARWANPSEASGDLVKWQVKFKVFADNNYEMTEVASTKVLNERARSDWGTMRFNYSPEAASMRVIDAWTAKDGKVANVPKSKIADAQISVSEYGYDEKRQIVVPFQQVEVGSELNFSTLTKSKIPFMDQFSIHYLIGERTIISDMDISFDSEKPLFVQINDPDGSINFQEEKKGQRYLYSFKLKKKVYKSVADEAAPYLPLSAKTWFAVSSAANNKDFFSGLAKQFENILKEPLPETLRPLVEEAKKITVQTDQINFVTTRIADQIRYMGDWRAVKGGYIPHSLAQIVSGQYGDCKDYSVLLAKIFRELGLTAYPAFILRSTDVQDQPDLPVSSYYNHAITAVILKDKTLWIDGTNFASNASGVPEDIADRKALILDASDIHLAQTDFGPAEKNGYGLSIKVIRTGKETIKSDVTNTYIGEYARKWTGEELRTSKLAIENRFLDSNYDRPTVISAKVAPFNLKSRIVSDLTMSTSAEKYFNKVQSSMGPSFSFPTLTYESILNVDGKDRVADFNNGSPTVWRSESTFENFSIQGRQLKKCKVSHPAVEYWFDVKYLKNGIRLVNELKIKKRFIAAKEIQTPEFKKFQKDLKACLGSKFIVYK